MKSVSGVRYYGHRYYSANPGRFINRDPIGESGGDNMYAADGNDSINHYDALGLYFGVIEIDQNGGFVGTSELDDGVPYYEGQLIVQVTLGSGSGFSSGSNTNGSSGSHGSTGTYIPPVTITAGGGSVSPPQVGTVMNGPYALSSVVNGWGGNFNGVNNGALFSPLYYDPNAPGAGPIANGQGFAAIANTLPSFGSEGVASATDLISSLSDDHGSLNSFTILAHSNPNDGPLFAGGSLLNDAFFSAAAAALNPNGPRIINFLSCSAFEDPAVQSALGYYASKYNLTLVGTDGLLALSIVSTRSGGVTTQNASVSASPGTGWVVISPGPPGSTDAALTGSAALYYITTYSSITSSAPIQSPYTGAQQLLVGQDPNAPPDPPTFRIPILNPKQQLLSNK